jgi:stage V sporulation protein G
MMTITNIKIRKLTDDEKMKAVASVTFDDELAVHDIKIIKGQDRLFVAMPSRKTNDGRFIDVVHPITQELRNMMNDEILKAYEEALASASSPMQGKDE